MPITTGDMAKFLWPGLNAIFNTSYNARPNEYSKIFDEVSSDQAYEEYTGFMGLGLSRVKGEGSPIFYDTMSQGFTRRVTNVTYGLGYVITREAVNDNKYLKATKARTKELARSESETREVVAANILNRAFNSSYTYVDGVELCSLAHLTKGGLTYKNELTTAADLSEASLEQMAIDIGDFVDERGKQIAVHPKTLIIPNELQFEAIRILQSVLQNDSANNAVNAVKSLNLKIEVNHWLTDADAYFIKTDVEDGMIYQNRQAAIFENDTEFNSKNMLFTAYSRYAFDVVDVRSVFGSPGA
jgi:phage major head subunit gpT-like protein